MNIIHINESGIPSFTATLERRFRFRLDLDFKLSKLRHPFWQIIENILSLIGKKKTGCQTGCKRFGNVKNLYFFFP